MRDDYDHPLDWEPVKIERKDKMAEIVILVESAEGTPLGVKAFESWKDAQNEMKHCLDENKDNAGYDVSLFETELQFVKT